MATTIDIDDLPAKFGELVDRAGAGGEVIVTQGGQPRAVLVPIPRPGRRVAGLHPGAMQPGPDFDAPLPDEFWGGD